MLDIDKFLAAKSESLEGLSYYEVLSRLGLLSFNSQGNRPMELVARLTGTTDSSSVLVVGCGAGGTTVHLAETTGALVFGVDVSAESIRAAADHVSKLSAGGRLHFLIGDAHMLPFLRGVVDVVVTEFVAFLLQQDAFEGFFSVLRPGGYVALAELVKDPKVDSGADARILAAEQTYSRLLGYDFHVPLVTQYVEWLERAGFEQVQVAGRFSEPGFREKIGRVGGWRNLFRITKVLLRLMWASRVIRKSFLQVGSVKRVLVQDKATAKYISQVVLTGLKPH